MQHIGKVVAIHTTGGEIIEGTIAQVTQKLVYIKELTLKDYFDAIVKLDRISNIEFRVKTP